MTRTFEDSPAVRERVPLLVAVYGPSGTGKTFSALRLASGMQRVTGGDVHVIDTEARRALHYADMFTFRHVPFNAPFSPLDYVAAIEHCAGKGARVVVIDSMSHEHEGVGGVLDWHDNEMTRLAGEDEKRRDKFKMLAWQAPKTARKRLIDAIIQSGMTVVSCFRAKEKLKMVVGRNPEPLGWMPIAGEDFLFEMTATALLLPGANGVPTWNPPHDGERAMIKRPLQFEAMFQQFNGAQLCEEMGETMARWAEGGPNSTFVRLRDALETADSLVALDAARSEVGAAKKRRALSDADVETLGKVRDKRREELASKPA